jgi:hypothetical protein
LLYCCVFSIKYSNDTLFKLGLPTKSRGKYKKRKLLSNEEKSEVLRATNRENARLTRKRKKIYHDVISSILIKLHQDLGSDTVRKYVNIVNEGKTRQYLENHLVGLEGVHPETIDDPEEANLSGISKTDKTKPNLNINTRLPGINAFQSSISSSILPLPQHLITDLHPTSIGPSVYPQSSSSSSSSSSSVLGTSNSASASSIDVISSRHRFDSIQAYLKLRVATCSSTFFYSNDMIDSTVQTLGWDLRTPSEADWLSICDSEVSHLMPLPVFRDMSDQAIMLPTGYECRGIPTILDDISCVRSFCQWVSFRITCSLLTCL